MSVKYYVFDSEATIHVGILLKNFAHVGLKLSGKEQLSLNDDVTQVAFLSVSTVAFCGKKVSNLTCFSLKLPLSVKTEEPKSFFVVFVMIQWREKVSAISWHTPNELLLQIYLSVMFMESVVK